MIMAKRFAGEFWDVMVELYGSGEG